MFTFRIKDMGARDSEITPACETTQLTLVLPLPVDIAIQPSFVHMASGSYATYSPVKLTDSQLIQLGIYMTSCAQLLKQLGVQDVVVELLRFNHATEPEYVVQFLGCATDLRRIDDYCRPRD